LKEATAVLSKSSATSENAARVSRWRLIPRNRVHFIWGRISQREAALMRRIIVYRSSNAVLSQVEESGDRSAVVTSHDEPGQRNHGEACRPYE
jgi:hypothetical protein